VVDDPAGKPPSDDPARKPPPGNPPTPEPAPTTPAGRRTARAAAIYAAYATGVLTIQVLLFTLLDEESLPLAAPVCLLLLPALAWAAGYLTLNAADRGQPGMVERAPKLGAVICLVPNALVCGCLGVLTLLR
jgi:hypothetical protein